MNDLSKIISHIYHKEFQSGGWKTDLEFLANLGSIATHNVFTGLKSAAKTLSEADLLHL